MANLLGQNIGTNYKGILSLDSTINTPLDATLRAVTDGEGNASPLQLSTDEVSVGAISGARLGIKGTGATSATTSLLVQNSSGTDVLKVTDDSVTNARGTINVLHPSVATRSLKLGWGSIFATDSGSELTLGAVFAVPSSPQILLAGNTRSSGANTMQLQASLGVSIAASLINPSAQLHIKGSGTTSATTALLVQNSAGSNAFKIEDNLTIRTANVVIVGGASETIGRLGFFNENVRIGRTGGSGLEFRTGSASVAMTIDSLQSVGIGEVSPNASSILDLSSTTKGFLPPRMTTTQKNAIATPASGLIVYDETTNKLACYNGTTWNDLF